MAYHKLAPLRGGSKEVENLRRSLPVAIYLTILHQAAATGKLPILNAYGQATGEVQDVSPKDRLDTARYLIDKVMPTLKAAEPDISHDATTLLSRDDTNNMTTSELVATIQSASSTSPDPSPADPGSAPYASPDSAFMFDFAMATPATVEDPA